jgi:ubiquinone biosynthesis protein UbiJ
MAAALSMDARTHEAIAALGTRVLELRVTVPELQVFVLTGEGGVRLAGHHEGSVDCIVSGMASDYISLLLAPDKPAALVNGNLRVSGDSSVLLALEKSLATLDIDWEERLATVIGEIPAHQIGRAARASAGIGRRARNAFERHLEEFIHEEARLAPPRQEVEDFLADLRQLSSRADRLEAGLRRIGRRIAARGDGSRGM